MHLIQPCCAQKDLRELRDSIAKGGTKKFEGYGDLSLSELLGPLLTRYSEVEMTIVAPSLPDQAAEIINKWMGRQWSRMDGKGKLDVIRHLTVIARLEKEKSAVIAAWLKGNPFGDRLTLVDIEQDDTVILLPDFAVTGPVNMRYGRHFVATATSDPETVKGLWDKYRGMAAKPAKRQAKTASRSSLKEKKREISRTERNRGTAVRQSAEDPSDSES